MVKALRIVSSLVGILAAFAFSVLLYSFYGTIFLDNVDGYYAGKYLLLIFFFLFYISCLLWGWWTSWVYPKYQFKNQNFSRLSVFFISLIPFVQFYYMALIGSRIANKNKAYLFIQKGILISGWVCLISTVAWVIIGINILFLGIIENEFIWILVFQGLFSLALAIFYVLQVLYRLNTSQGYVDEFELNEIGKSQENTDIV